MFGPSMFPLSPKFEMNDYNSSITLELIFEDWAYFGFICLLLALIAILDKIINIKSMGKMKDKFIFNGFIRYYI